MPDTVYEIEHRAIQGRYLFLPTQDCRDRFVGAVARALQEVPSIALFAFVYLSNHFHALFSSRRAEEIPRFLWHLNRSISAEVDELYDWPGTVWEGRPHLDVVVDPAAAERRLAYILSNGCKEGLVASPLDWPGASAAPALVGNMTLEGFCLDRDARRADRRRGVVAPSTAYQRRIELELSPLPHLADLPPDALRAHYQTIVTDVEAFTAATNERLGRRPVGVEALLAHDPHYRPPALERTPEPICHASSAPLWRVFRAAWQAFDDACARASKALARAMQRTTAGVAGSREMAEAMGLFPPGSFPPGGALVPCVRGLAHLWEEIEPLARGPT